MTPKQMLKKLDSLGKDELFMKTLADLNDTLNDQLALTPAQADAITCVIMNATTHAVRVIFHSEPENEMPFNKVVDTLPKLSEQAIYMRDKAQNILSDFIPPDKAVALVTSLVGLVMYTTDEIYQRKEAYSESSTSNDSEPAAPKAPIDN